MGHLAVRKPSVDKHPRRSSAVVLYASPGLARLVGQNMKTLIARNTKICNCKSVSSSTSPDQKDIEDALNAEFWWRKMAAVIAYIVCVKGLCPGRLLRLYER